MNYMDNFKTEEDFIKHEILANRGTQNVVDKAVLLTTAQQHGITVNNNMTKEAVYNKIREKLSLEELLKYCSVGVSSVSFQQKFDISHEEVKRMARLGFIRITGTQRFRAYGKYRYADLYSASDYFDLTKEEVKEFLEKNPKGTRKSQMVRG